MQKKGGRLHHYHESVGNSFHERIGQWVNCCVYVLSDHFRVETILGEEHAITGAAHMPEGTLVAFAKLRFNYRSPPAVLLSLSATECF